MPTSIKAIASAAGSTTLYVGTQGLSDVSVFKTSDGGVRWSPSSEGLPSGGVNALAMVSQTPTTLYAGTFSGVFKSTDGGASWSPNNVGLSDLAVRGLVVTPSGTCVHVGTDAGVFSFAIQTAASCPSPPVLSASIRPNALPSKSVPLEQLAPPSSTTRPAVQERLLGVALRQSPMAALRRSLAE